MFYEKSLSLLTVSFIISILAGCGGNTAKFQGATLTGAQLVSISVTPPNPTIAVNTDQQCLATGMFSDNTTRDVTSNVTWISSDVDAVDVVSGTEAAGFTASPDLDISRSGTLSSPGHIKAKRPGQVRITAKWGSISGFTDVTVTPAALVSISITPPDPSIAQGTIQQFIATGTFSDGTTQNLTEGVDWSISAGAVGSINNEAGSRGLASALAAGSTTVTASSGSISGSSTLTVTSAVLISIAITPANPSIKAGTTQKFTAMGTFSDNSIQNLTATVTWNRADTDIASMYNTTSYKGLAAAWSAGSTTITAILGNISASTVLTVTSATLVSITVSPTNPSMVVGSKQQFTATGTFSDNSIHDITVIVNWSSSAAGVANISNAVGSRGLVTSVAAGSTTITAGWAGITGTAALTVGVGGEVGGFVTLSWDAPTTNTDGSALNPATDLTLYKIYYGTTSGTYTQVANFTNPGTTTLTKTLNLSPGTYYFAVTTVDAAGTESDYSNEVMKSI